MLWFFLQKRSFSQFFASGVFVILLSFSPSIAQANDGKFSPPKGKHLLLIGQDVDNIDSYVQATGCVPAGFSLYTSVQLAQGITRSFDVGAGVQNFDYVVKKYPNTVIHMALYLVEALPGVLSGRYDGKIQTIIDWIKNVKRPVYFRIGYEFDSPENGYDPDLYQRAFRYIVDKFRENHVENVAFVWHSYAAYGSKHAMKWYPGDDYVDWFAISYFNAYNKVEPQFIADLAKQHGKPLMIAESSPAKTGTLRGKLSWKIFFEKYFQFIEDNDVKIFAYINCDWDSLPQFKALEWGDCRVQQNKVVLRRWKKELNKRKYLESSKNLFNMLGYRPR